jgi:hypothetical protein
MTTLSDADLARLDASAAPSDLWPGSIEPQPLTPQQEADVAKILAAVACGPNVDWGDVQELAPDEAADAA